MTERIGAVEGWSATRTLDATRTIALVAQDPMKDALLSWAKARRRALGRHALIGTAMTGELIARHTGLTIERLLSGPPGGDQQFGARIAEGRVDMLIFFRDPLQSVPHDPAVKALLRLATVWNIPVA